MYKPIWSRALLLLFLLHKHMRRTSIRNNNNPTTAPIPIKINLLWLSLSDESLSSLGWGDFCCEWEPGGDCDNFNQLSNLIWLFEFDDRGVDEEEGGDFPVDSDDIFEESLKICHTDPCHSPKIIISCRKSHQKNAIAFGINQKPNLTLPKQWTRW